MLPFKNSEVFDRWIEGLIKAGYKEGSLNYYKVQKENKMTGDKIRKLVFGNKIISKRFGTPWSIIINKNGESKRTWFSFAQKKSVVHKGKIWIEGDSLCQRYKTLHDGLKDCADIYKNPAGNKQTLSEYILITDYWLYLFSIEE